jgi:monothiol glutaredoxin
MNNATQHRIKTLLDSEPVVLFMKGTRDTPRCGFSAKAVGLLDAALDDYATVDVLADEEMRQGIKEYGQWPTIPQLYVRGELIGGSDIISQMAGNGELYQVLGVPAPSRPEPPTISITAEAANAIRSGMEDAGQAVLHLQINAQWQSGFQIEPAGVNDIVANAAGIAIHMDAATAKRAQGMQIDWTNSLQGSGLAITLPLAPKGVQAMAVAALRQAVADGVRIIDVRPEPDRLRAPFPLAHSVLDGHSISALSALPKDSALAFLCHHGNSSRSAAEHFRSLGFSQVYNIEGGIEAYANQVDSSVPRY